MSSFISENLHAIDKLERVVDKLIKGKETAICLQTLLSDPVPVRGSVPVQKLLLQIQRSFTESISELSCCTDSAESALIATVDGGGSACSGESKKRMVRVKDRRGCYKRRKTSDSWTKKSSTLEDVWAWRKYGQKIIQNSKYPRCYYRCTHKNEGCKALKQVQRMEEDPLFFQITYINHHTCTNRGRVPQLILDDDYPDPHGKPDNLLSFQINNHNPKSKQEENDSTKPMIVPDAVIREEELKEDTQSNLSEAKSSLLDPLEDVTFGSGSFGSYRPVWDPIGFDFEVNKLDDIDDLHFDDKMY